jgi:hypothetical protein
MKILIRSLISNLEKVQLVLLRESLDVSLDSVSNGLFGLVKSLSKLLDNWSLVLVRFDSVKGSNDNGILSNSVVLFDDGASSGSLYWFGSFSGVGL